MQDSRSQLDSVQIEQAIAQYLQQIATSPQAAEVYLDLGNLYVRQEQWQQAAESYRQAIALKPDCASAHRHLAEVHHQQGNHGQAANHLFKAFRLQPDAATAKQHYELGQTLQSQDKPARAIACYRAAIEAQTDFWDAYHTLSGLLTKQGKDERAIEVYRQGVRQNPQNSDYYFALASALAARKKWVRACNNYRQAAELKPSAKIYYHWGLALDELQEYEQSQSCFQQAAELEPSAKIYYHWGLALNELQEYQRARECFQQAIALEDHPPAYYQLGLLWQAQQQWQQAIAAYTKVVSLDSQFAPALIDLGLVYRNLKQYDLAIACYRQAIEHLAESALAEAFTGYQQTLEQHPQPTAALYYQLAKLLRAKSLFPEAIAAYCKSIELDPNFKNAYIDLQYTPVGKQTTRLIEFYRQIVTKHPEITIAWGNLGDALTQQERISEAIDCYRTCSYQKAIQTYPELAKLEWQEQKKSGPDFIIAGASKSGTSSIYYYLSRHPQILLSHKKEIDFYWKNFDRGIDWYLAHFPSISDRPDFLTGEATPNYLRFPQIAQRIKDTFPQTKIIILLRNPVDRAISWHYHKLNTGLTKVALETAIATEIERLATVSETEIINTGFYDPDNIISSLYIYKIKAWIEFLGREQFLILKSEEFYARPLEVMAEVFNFLGLSNCTLDNYPKVNAGSYNRVAPNIRKTLSEYFAPYNRQLEEYLGMQFDWE
ncbi:tetratricopeptide repeat protein [Pleurocapsales cyanobacterium LEGE 10410]|nr:tetratricopeptide repeat protein [Pleurocapsales cyanobacterium LEGE 10410]